MALVAFSTGGVYRTDDGGASWRPRNVGVRAEFLPDKHPEFGQCVHKVAVDAGELRPDCDIDYLADALLAPLNTSLFRFQREQGTLDDDPQLVTDCRREGLVLFAKGAPAAAQQNDVSLRALADDDRCGGGTIGQAGDGFERWTPFEGRRYFGRQPDLRQ